MFNLNTTDIAQYLVIFHEKVLPIHRYHFIYTILKYTVFAHAIIYDSDLSYDNTTIVLRGLRGRPLTGPLLSREMLVPRTADINISRSTDKKILWCKIKETFQNLLKRKILHLESDTFELCSHCNLKRISFYFISKTNNLISMKCVKHSSTNTVLCIITCKNTNRNVPIHYDCQDYFFTILIFVREEYTYVYISINQSISFISSQGHRY